MASPQLSIVVPAFNELPNLGPLVERITAALDPLATAYEIIIVDDGSRDSTPALIADLRAEHPPLQCIRLARNFGHQAALFAGLEYSRGLAVVTLDADLQHPPELIPELVERWRAGFDVVQAVRTATQGESVAKNWTSAAFYRLLSTVTQIRLVPGSADFRLMSRPAVDALLQCRERVRFHRGLVQWIGFSVAEVPYEAASRFAGRTKYSWASMIRLAANAIFSFSSWPLRLAGMAGVVVSFAALAYLAFVLWAKFFSSAVVPGWSSILAAVLALGGMQLVVLWIIGEYLGRLYEEAKQRPLYVVKESTIARAAPIIAGHFSNGAADGKTIDGVPFDLNTSVRERIEAIFISPPALRSAAAPPSAADRSQPVRPQSRVELDED
ncbi:MAG: glycosyltransferase family 2 protein [Phycisphaerae bacterium]|nr:glycosyltransferase family 2 protein [Phycisphaerae bacterium]